MAATYSGDPANNEVDYLRFMVGDTDVSSPLLQDAEYQYIVDLYSINVNKRLSQSFRSAANAIGIKATKRSLGPQSEDNSARLTYYANMADKYEKAAAFSTVPPLPDYAAEKVFYKDLMANET